MSTQNNEALHALSHRPEIDGLRAIAVLAVVIYHADLQIAGINMFPGGFIGVDIFFVISGYLITRIILFEHQTGQFSLISFYERRARRLLPLLLTVVTLSIIAGYQLMLPKPFKELLYSAVSSIFFTANVWFMLEESYWADIAALKPLLHTWSLAVEEQFYLIYPPLLLLAIAKLRDKRAEIVLAVTLLSMAACFSLNQSHANYAFYLFPFRAWELLLGALLAFPQARILQKLPGTMNSWLSCIALSALLFSLMAFDSHTGHPSPLTLIPVLSTALVIALSSHSGWLFPYLNAQTPTTDRTVVIWDLFVALSPTRIEQN